jgi:hypothetical protein
VPLFSNGPTRPFFAFPERLTESTVRLVAAGVCVGIGAGWATNFGWVLPLLALDFALRVAAGPRLSPLTRIAVPVTIALHLPKRSVAGAPKQFAAAIGFGVLASASALYLAGLPGAAWATAGVVALLAGCEAALGVCLGCRVYEALFGCADCTVSQCRSP